MPDKQFFNANKLFNVFKRQLNRPIYLKTAKRPICLKGTQVGLK